MRRGEWEARVRLAAERFGLAPEAFWRLSLPEWRALTETGEAQVMSRARLEALAEEHPDERVG